MFWPVIKLDQLKCLFDSLISSLLLENMTFNARSSFVFTHDTIHSSKRASSQQFIIVLLAVSPFTFDHFIRLLVGTFGNCFSGASCLLFNMLPSFDSLLTILLAMAFNNIACLKAIPISTLLHPF